MIQLSNFYHVPFVIRSSSFRKVVRMSCSSISPLFVELVYYEKSIILGHVNITGFVVTLGCPQENKKVINEEKMVRFRFNGEDKS